MLSSIDSAPGRLFETSNLRSLLPSKSKAHKTLVLELTSIPTNKVDIKLFFMVSPPFNGEKSTIYMDTGSTRSFLDFEHIEDNEIEVKLLDKEYKFNCSKLKYEKIRFQEKFEYPLRLATNSDLLKSNHFAIIFELIQNNLIIYQN